MPIRRVGPVAEFDILTWPELTRVQHLAEQDEARAQADRARAAAVVASSARNAADAAELLDAIGLTAELPRLRELLRGGPAQP